MAITTNERDVQTNNLAKECHALREAVANAYRLKITSSGTLHFGLTVEDLFRPHESLPWNPLIAGVFYRRGIIEAWGRGTLKMAELTTLAGLPRPEIEDAGGGVTVRFRPSRYCPPPARPS